jgi:hypothetical protein
MKWVPTILNGQKKRKSPRLISGMEALSSSIEYKQEPISANIIEKFDNPKFLGLDISIAFQSTHQARSVMTSVLLEITTGQEPQSCN